MTNKQKFDIIQEAIGSHKKVGYWTSRNSGSTDYVYEDSWKQSGHTSTFSGELEIDTLVYLNGTWYDLDEITELWIVENS